MLRTKFQQDKVPYHIIEVMHEFFRNEIWAGNSLNLNPNEAF